MTWFLAIANFFILVGGIVAWWKQYRIRLEERKLYTIALEAARAEKEAAILTERARIVEEFATRQKVRDAEFEALQSDPGALLDWFNRQLRP